MVVCKFFQQGYCRYGQNCRFEHVYGSKYSYHAPQPSNPPPQPQSAVTDEQLVNQVISDVQAALKGGQWILSNYAPFKEKPMFPGLTDLSPEEARLFIYEAKQKNNVDQAVAYLSNLFKENRQKYEQLLQPNPAIIKVLRDLYKGECPSATQSTALGTSKATSVFRTAVENTSVFGQPQASSQSGFQNTNIFGGNTNSDPAKSIFAQATHNVFGTTNNVFGPQSPKSSNIFAAQNNDAANIFAAPNSNSPNVFAANDPAKSIFAQATKDVFASPPAAQTNIFASASQQYFGNNSFNQSQTPLFQSTATPNNVFQKAEQPANVFGVATQNVFEQRTDHSGVYSKIEDLTVNDLEAFKSNEFKLGFVPELAPPRELCT